MHFSHVSTSKIINFKNIMIRSYGTAILQSVALVSMILLFFSGCTTTAIKSSESDDSFTRQQSLGKIPDSWTINGRISVINEQENWYAKFTWIQQEQDFQLNFTGPLGETELQVSQIAQNVRLKTPAKERTGHNLEQLLQQETGWSLPITSLRYWSQGYPNPAITAQLKYNKEQQISDIFQAGWHIQYHKRMLAEQVSGPKIWLPKKIIATKQDIKIKLIITRWHLGESSFSLID